MAASSLLTLIDDIASILDDVSVMTQMAAKKTAGVLGDDLALNARQVAGVNADRELPVVWAVARGSFVNKLILVPAAVAISALIPAAIVPLLMLGGAFLCFEGFEKLAHKFLHSRSDDAHHHEELVRALSDQQVDMLAFEREKVKGAVRTDFILSAEIIVISLGTVANASFVQQLTVLAAISVIMTIGVYGLVAGIVKLDDAGLYLTRSAGQLRRAIGSVLLGFAPRLMKTLSVVGTAAMFMVGGGILVHGIGPLHHGVEHVSTGAADIATVGGLLAAVLPTVLGALIGVVAGGLVLIVVSALKRLLPGPAAAV